MKEFTRHYDIAVIGGGPAGLATAITAAREGKKVLLADKNGFLGGNLTIGLPLLGFLDEHGNQCISGFAEELVRRLQERDACYGIRPCPKHNSVTNVDAEAVKILAFEMCREAGVEVLLHVEAIDAAVDCGRIDTVTLYGKCNRITVRAELFVDCTGDGDVGCLAGCSYETGRGKEQETMPPTVMCTIENVNDAALLDYVEEHPDEMKPMSATIETKPGYDAAYFKADPNYVFVGMTRLWSKLKEQGVCPVERGNMIVINGVHKGQMYVNTTRLLDVDGTNVFDLTRGEMEGHLQLYKLIDTFRKYVPGFENCYISSIAPNIGIRETRRMKGLDCITLEQALKGAISDSSICLSGYTIDIHYNNHRGTLFKKLDRPFGIPYGCLVSAELSNLMFAGRCISVDDHVVGSIRVMPCCMAMGQAAGLAAAMAVTEKLSPAEIDVEKLREALRAQGAILSMNQ
ncbi:MAG: FAD-dependent oxidoreductase [Ruminococcaceae bacterium]|nr:FAD-dependent oxidoreductase [Oscillospiraceae bacterium]